MLIGNYSVLNKNPGRCYSGTIRAGSKAHWQQPGALRNRFQAFSPLTGQPHAYRPPHAWLLPQKDGALGSNTMIRGAGTLAAPIAGGKNATAALQGAGMLAGTGQLIVSLAATLAGQGLIGTADLRAILQAIAALQGVGTLSAQRGAVAGLVAGIEGHGSMSVIPSALGELAATITQEAATISPSSIAAAVWDAAATGSNGTMGGLLVLLRKLGLNAQVTDPVAHTFTIFDDDDVTPLYVASLFEDADGTVGYRGQGAERRERLE